RAHGRGQRARPADRRRGRDRESIGGEPMNLAEIQHAASQAWVGFWKTCMGDVGARSLLDCDEAIVQSALDARPATAIVPTIDLTPPEPQRTDLAKRLEGDERIGEITIRDMLIGLD